MANKLTPKQERFITEYGIDLNATKAAIRAGYSERSARQTGADLIAKPYISAKINEMMAESRQNNAISRQDVLNNLHTLNDVSMKQVTDKDGNVIGVRNASVAIKANELMGKHYAMFTDKVEHSGEINHTGVLMVGHGDLKLDDWISAAGGALLEDKIVGNGK